MLIACNALILDIDASNESKKVTKSNGLLDYSSISKSQFKYEKTVSPAQIKERTIEYSNMRIISDILENFVLEKNFKVHF